MIHTKFKRFVESIEQTTISDKDINDILEGYLGAAIWTEEERLEEEYPDVDLNIHNFTDESREKAIEDIKKFINICPMEDIQIAIENSGLEQIGHDIWLSRNGHGAGFFDRDYINANALQKCAEKLGNVTLEISDDTKKLSFL